jgi:hypothetical protein
MSEIKRYYLQDEKRDNEPCWYVNADDHIAALKQAKIEAVLEFGEWLDNRDVLEGEYYYYSQYADDYIEQLKEQWE